MRADRKAVDRAAWISGAARDGLLITGRQHGWCHRSCTSRCPCEASDQDVKEERKKKGNIYVLSSTAHAKPKSSKSQRFERYQSGVDCEVPDLPFGPFWLEVCQCSRLGCPSGPCRIHYVRARAKKVASPARAASARNRRTLQQEPWKAGNDPKTCPLGNPNHLSIDPLTITGQPVRQAKYHRRSKRMDSLNAPPS